METFKIRTHVGSDGILKFEMPVGVLNTDWEVVVVAQPLATQEVDELGWPIGFFERTYGALADDPIERGEELPPDVRDEIE